MNEKWFDRDIEDLTIEDAEQAQKEGVDLIFACGKLTYTILFDVPYLMMRL
jgi:hypothetical protein